MKFSLKLVTSLNIFRIGNQRHFMTMTSRLSQVLITLQPFNYCNWYLLVTVINNAVSGVHVGPPGVEKADLAQTLAEATGRTHLSVGHMLREEAKKDTEEAQMIIQSIQMGVLVDTVSVRASWHIYHKCCLKRKTCLSTRIAEMKVHVYAQVACCRERLKRDGPTEQPFNNAFLCSFF